jgi:DNA-binding PadR family transcriptional regulator
MEHQFCIELASSYGIEEAIIIHNLYFWIKKNVANGSNFHDGRYWTYNSSKAFSILFPYMTESKIYRVLKSLEEKGLIVKGNYNDTKYDRTTWYSLSDKALEELNVLKYDTNGFSESILRKEEKDFAKMQNGIYESEEPIPYSKHTDSNTDKKEDTIVSKKDDLDYDLILNSWNNIADIAVGVSKVKSITDDRKKIIKRLITKCKTSVEEIVKLINTIPYADDWVLGKGGKDWTINFDFLMKNTSNWYVRALEGDMHRKNRYEFDKIMNGECLSLHTENSDTPKFQF